MYKVVFISLLAAGLSLTAKAQTFLDRLQKSQNTKGAVTVHQDAAIDALVNGPQTATNTPAQKQQKAGDSKQQQTVTATEQGKTKPATANNTTAEKQTVKEQRQHEPEREKSDTTTDSEGTDSRKKVMRNSYKVMGFRVQAFAGGNTRQDRQKAEQVGEKIKANIPGEPVYVHFYSPRWICRVGNYRTYEEAHQMLLAIRKLGYTQASIVKGKISVQY